MNYYHAQHKPSNDCSWKDKLDKAKFNKAAIQAVSNSFEQFITFPLTTCRYIIEKKHQKAAGQI